jgi:hypothetical protein
MNIAIYQTVNAHAPAIHWWLAQDKRFGPQLYERLDPVCNGDQIGSIVQEIRGADVTDHKIYDAHQESLRELENKKDVNGIVDCTSAYFDANKGFWGNGEDPIVGYEYPVWSNYFGCTKNTQAVPLCDKLLFAQSTVEQSAMFYITQYAFNKITINDIDDHSKIWWEDHMLMGGEVIGNWKEIWYKDYHNKCIDDFHNNKLQYMWQLNFAHWDLFNSLENSDGKFDLDYSPKRLFEEKHNTDDIEAQDVSIKSMKENNVDHLLVDIEWFNNTDVILDYLSIKNSKALDDAALLYKERYKVVCKAYEELSNKYYKGIIL